MAIPGARGWALPLQNHMDSLWEMKAGFQRNVRYGFKKERFWADKCHRCPLKSLRSRAVG